MTITILIVDDQPLLRQGFRMILSAHPDLKVIGEASDGREAIRLTRELQPDIVLMDVRMPNVNGIAATEQIVAESPQSKVIILTTFDLDEYAFAGLKAGASGFLLKDALPEDLVAGIRTVATGDAVNAPSTTRRLLNAFASQLAPGTEAPVPPPLDRLTDRERQVVAEIAAGLTNTEIASKLFLSEATVKTHIGHILSKLQLRDRVQVVIYAFRSGFADARRPPDGGHMD